MRLTSLRSDPLRWRRVCSGFMIVSYAMSIVIMIPANPSLWLAFHASTLILLLVGIHLYLFASRSHPVDDGP